MTENKQVTLRRKSILITGGSRGLGRALANEFSREGARVVIAARESPELYSTVEEIRANGGEAFALVADLSDRRAIHPLAAQAAELAGPVDILVNNASTLGPTPLRLLLDTDCEDLERALATNLVGPFRLTKLLMGSMVLRGKGLVINISSDTAVSAYPAWGAYSVSKAALDHLTRIWTAEIEETGVRLLSVDPGEMDTRMHAEAIPDADRTKLASPDFIARKLIDLLKKPLPNSSRVVLPEWEE